MRALVVTAPREAGVLEVPDRSHGQASCSSRSNASGSAAPMSSSTRARWRTSSRASCISRCGSGTSGQVASSPQGPRMTMAGSASASRATPCSAADSASTASRAPARLPDPVRGRHPRRVGWRARRTRARADAVRVRDPRAREPCSGRARRARRQRPPCGPGRALEPGHRVLVLGSGTIGLLAAQFALAAGAEVHVAGKRAGSLALAVTLGVQNTTTLEDSRRARGPLRLGHRGDEHRHHAALSVRLAKPAGRVVYIGLSSTPSLVDSRGIALKDITAVGILSASPVWPARSRASRAARSCPTRSSAR